MPLVTPSPVDGRLGVLGGLIILSYRGELRERGKKYQLGFFFFFFCQNPDERSEVLIEALKGDFLPLGKESRVSYSPQQ